MRILIIADVHGNWPALRTVLAEPHDAVMFLGDAVDFGPRPKECVNALRSEATWAVQGNHDYGIGDGTSCRCFGPWRAWDDATRLHALRMLDANDRAYLRDLPLSQHVEADGTSFRLVHAAPSDPLYRYLPADITDAELDDELSRVSEDVLLVGHTHVPMMRHVGSRIVVNPGSVGMPRDGGPAACCAVWDHGEIEFRRVPYPVAEVIEEIETLDLPADVARGLTAQILGTPHLEAI